MVNSTDLLTEEQGGRAGMNLKRPFHDWKALPLGRVCAREKGVARLLPISACHFRIARDEADPFRFKSKNLEIVAQWRRGLRMSGGRQLAGHDDVWLRPCFAVRDVVGDLRFGDVAGANFGGYDVRTCG